MSAQYSIIKSIVYKQENVNFYKEPLRELFTTLNNSGHFVMTRLDIIPISIDGMISTNAFITIGTNRPSYDNILSAYGILSTVIQTTQDTNINKAGTTFIIAPNSNIYLNITRNCDVIYIANIYITGYYENSNDNI